MSVIGLLILQVVMLRSADAQFGGGAGGGGRGGGGPSTFGYDASSACSKPYSRHGRARFEKLPCDFRRQNWCTVAGSAYPWQAVRRFVQENHGLMKRMYGDERHINILKDELEKNDVELEYEDRNERYPEDARRFHYDDDYEFVDFDYHQDNNQRMKSRDDDTYQGRSFADGSIEQPTTDQTSKYTKSPEDSTTSRDRSTDPSSTAPSTTTAATTSGKLSQSSDPTTQSTSTANPKNPDEPSLRPSSTTSSIFIDATVKKTANSSERFESIDAKNSSNSEKLTPTVAAVTLADIARIKNSSINEIPGKSETSKDDAFDGGREPNVPESSIEDTTVDPEGNPGPTIVSTIDRMDEIDPDEISKDAGVAEEKFATVEETQQEFRPRPEYNKPAENKPENSSHKSQLFQDVAAKDKHDQPVLKLRGVNACPVKEEVVAPFWANNTRGEVLALLNLYPFEQYVHWEKCTHENKQMYCRDGCRCEQQYRLHRLLAYDPNNECRGIFSDWFKFPSCCVCRCYDLPIEFRVTSRSPRMQKQKIKLRTSGHRRG